MLKHIRTLSTSLLLATCVAALPTPAHAQDDGLGPLAGRADRELAWADSIDAAMERAKAEDKPVMIIFAVNFMGSNQTEKC